MEQIIRNDIKENKEVHLSFFHWWRNGGLEQKSYLASVISQETLKKKKKTPKTKNQTKTNSHINFSFDTEAAIETTQCTST